MVDCRRLELQPAITTKACGYGSLLSQGRQLVSDDSYFCIALRSTKVLPPFILWASGASLIWITTASASTPRFFTSACVMSRIIPAFCSSVRPAAMLTVISGIGCSLLLFVSRTVIVIAGPDPAIHHLKDGCAGQARA